MKIYINKPRNHWVSPYKFIEKIYFWEEIDYDDPKVEKLYAILEPFSKGLEKILNFVHPSISYIKIDGWDVWNMDYTLSTIIVKMLQKIKDNKGGCTFIQKEDVPPELRSDDEDENENVINRWNYAIGEMIFAFESDTKDWEKEFCTGEFDMEFVETNRKLNGCKITTLEKGPNHTYQRDEVGIGKYRARMDEGRRLFGKYYNGLWT